MTTLYGVPVSPFVRKVIITLELKGVDYSLQPVTPMSLPEGYEKLHPLKKIPAFVDDDASLADSSVICDYLEEKYPEPCLRPGDAAQRANGRWIEEFADTKLIEKIGPPIFFQRVVRPAFLQESCDEEMVQNALNNDLPELFDYLETKVNGAEFLQNQTITLSDIALVCPLINLYLAGESVDAARWPKLAAYYEFVVAHPAVAKCIEQEKAMIGG